MHVTHVKTAPALRLRSWKALFDERRIRVVPRALSDGRPFLEPGIDVLGEAARALFGLLQPILDWFAAREPGATVRSLSFDLDRGRALATLRFDEPGRGHVQALRVDEATSPDLFDLARSAEPAVAAAATVVLARRPVQPTRA
jgi:hypothetical protein